MLNISCVRWKVTALNWRTCPTASWRRYSPSRGCKPFLRWFCAGWNGAQNRALAQELRPSIPAVTETIEAGTLCLDIRIYGQHPGARPGVWYETLRLYLLITGLDFVVPYGWKVFSEPLGLFTLYACYPEALAHSHQGPDTSRRRDSSASTS